MPRQEKWRVMLEAGAVELTRATQELDAIERVHRNTTGARERERLEKARASAVETVLLYAREVSAAITYRETVARARTIQQKHEGAVIRHIGPEAEP